MNLSIFVIDSIGPFFFHLCDDEPRLLMNKDTFILGPSNQSLRLARQDKGGFSQIWHGLACSGSVKERPGMHRVDHNH